MGVLVCGGGGGVGGGGAGVVVGFGWGGGEGCERGAEVGWDVGELDAVGEFCAPGVEPDVGVLPPAVVVEPDWEVLAICDEDGFWLCAMRARLIPPIVTTPAATPPVISSLVRLRRSWRPGGGARRPLAASR